MKMSVAGLLGGCLMAAGAVGIVELFRDEVAQHSVITDPFTFTALMLVCAITVSTGFLKIVNLI